VSDDATDIGARVRELLLAYERHGAQLRKQLGLSANEELVLLFLAHGTAAPTELSTSVGMTTAGMTNLLDRLEATGFVRRERHATDGRRVLVTLTKRGFRVHMQLQQVNDELADLARGQGESAVRELGGFLDAATTHLLDRSRLAAGSGTE
jgi:DNA-binding MarR family transcriptional regulator